MKKYTAYKLRNLTLTLVFCLAIFIPFLTGLIQADKAVSGVEKRELSKLPQFPNTLDAAETFPSRFEAYYSDHFGLRELFTRYYKLAKYHMGDSSSDNVILGKNGWLFLGSVSGRDDIYGDPVGDVRNVNLYSQEDLIRTAGYLEDIRNRLRVNGIEYVFVLAPNKHTVYYENLPDYISRVNEISAADQLISYLKKHTDINIVDLREVLIREKDRFQLYYKTDSHWNHYAANIAQYAIISEIERLFPGKISPELMTLNDGVTGGGDLADLMGLDIFEDQDPQPVFKDGTEPLHCPESFKAVDRFISKDQTLNALIYRDSFFNSMQPYFSRKLKRSTYIWEKSTYSSLVKYVLREKPDLVIEEWVERSLPAVPGETLRQAIVKMQESASPVSGNL